MNITELEKKIQNLEVAVKEDVADKKSLIERKKELAKFKNIYKSALSYSEEIKDQNTAVILYTTKQANMFLGFSRGVVRRIRKGYYVNKQNWLLNLLKSTSKKDRLNALKILRFDISKFKDVNVMEIKFESIEKELDKKFWSF